MTNFQQQAENCLHGLNLKELQSILELDDNCVLAIFAYARFLENAKEQNHATANDTGSRRSPPPRPPSLKETADQIIKNSSRLRPPQISDAETPGQVSQKSTPLSQPTHAKSESERER